MGPPGMFKAMTDLRPQLIREVRNPLWPRDSCVNFDLESELNAAMAVAELLAPRPS